MPADERGEELLVERRRDPPLRVDVLRPQQTRYRMKLWIPNEASKGRVMMRWTAPTTGYACAEIWCRSVGGEGPPLLPKVSLTNGQSEV